MSNKEKDLEKLAQNNLEVQLDLSEQIYKHETMAISYISLEAQKIRVNLDKTKYNEDYSRTLSKEEYADIYRFISNLCSRNDFYSLNENIREYDNSIRFKKQILSNLKK